ncbi:Type 1 glutamine amidotransferase-like domain-containing protein [soil metagenome]
MNRVFLTSQASEVLEKIVLLIPENLRKGNVLFIPTAAKPYPSAPWLEKDRAKLVELGFSVKNLDLEGITENELNDEIASTDIIFVGGGNTFYLLEHAKKSGFIKIVQQAIKDGKIYIGSSAGSVLATPDIKYVERFDDPSIAQLEDTKALALVDFRILPHSGNPKYEDIQVAVISEYQSEDSRIISVKDNEFLLKNGDLWGLGTP